MTTHDGAIGDARKRQNPDPWAVGIVAQTIHGEVTLKMTEDQAVELRDGLVWLTEDGDDD